MTGEEIVDSSLITVIGSGDVDSEGVGRWDGTISISMSSSATGLLVGTEAEKGEEVEGTL